VSRSRFPDSLGHEPGQDGDVQDVAGSDECASSRRWELSETLDGLLSGDEGTLDVDGRITAKLGEGDREGIVG
jgi:hypothetical protein